MSVILWGSSDSPEGSYERAIHDAFVPWTIKRIPQMVKSGVRTFGPCGVFVVASSADPKARILAAVVFHNHHPAYRMIEVSMAADSPMWARPSIISTLLHYVFNTLRCERLQATVPRRGAGPKHTRRFLEHLGFKYEGVGRKAFGSDDAVMFSMLRDDAARWLKGTGNAIAA